MIHRELEGPLKSLYAPGAGSGSRGFMSVKLFRPKDAEKLANAHPALAAVILKAAEMGGRFIVDQTIRGRAKQEEAARTGHSRAHFGQSAHNYSPALAADCYPVTERGQIIWLEQAFRDLAILMFAAARKCNTDIDWGGDWKTIKDLPHFQLSGWRSIAAKEKLAP